MFLPLKRELLLLHVDYNWSPWNSFLTHYVGCHRDAWWRWRYVVSTYLTFYVTPNINQLRAFETLFCTFLMPKNFNHKSLGNLTLKGSSPDFSKNRINSVIEREQKYHDQREHVEETKKTLKVATSLINSISSFLFLFSSIFCLI